MVVLRALLLWGLISVHIVGAAVLFRRIFPRESRWLAFIVPEIVLVLFCNFVEHHLALTALRFVLPVTTVGSVVLMASRKCPWRTLRLPAFLFLGAFAFSLMLRLLRPDIEDMRDGIADLGLISDFMFGQTLPVESTWLPPVKLLYYYCLEHYGASVLIRLLGVDMGTGLNLCAALLSAYICFFAGAAAWHLSRGKLWITILIPVLTACAPTGATGYLWLTQGDLAPLNTTDLHTLFRDETPPEPWLLRQMTPVYFEEDNELIPPGMGAWTGYFHSTNAGQLVLCFALLSLVELLRRKRTNWPWICLILAPFLMLTTCTWGLPMTGFLLLSGLIVCARMKIGPESRCFVLAVSAGLICLLEPMLGYFLQLSPPAIQLTPASLHTQWPEFVLQWWPIYLPWIALCCIWKRLLPATRLILVMTPLAYAGTELFKLGWRIDMTGKSWALIYVAAWIVFLPEIARQKAILFRVILVLIAIASALSLCFWVTYDARTLNAAEVGRLEGLGPLRLDRRKARILEILSHLDSQIVIPGKVDGMGGPNALLVAFSHNRSYATAESFSDQSFYTNGLNEVGRRFASVDALYKGKLLHPLYFLRQNNVSAVVIYPEDNISDTVVDQLKKDLAPYYTYEDANFRTVDELQKDVSPERPCAGVFVFHPEITALLGPVKEEGK